MSALAALVLVVLLPALAGGLLMAGPPQTSTDLRLARGTACGIAAWLLGSGLLTRTVGLTGTSAWIWDSVVAAASLVVLLLPRNRARWRSVVGPALRRLAVTGGLTAVVFLPLGYVIVRTSWSPLGSTPWYYYGLARQVADAGSIPATSLEFATTTPFLNDYHLFTTGTAMLLVQHPGGPIAVITLVTLLGALLLGLGTAALTSALGGGRLAGLIAIPVALATGIGPIRLAAYRPEGFALGLTLLVAALSIHWLRSRDRRSLIAAALLVATLSQVHGVAAVTAAVLVTAAAIVSLLHGPRPEHLRRIGIALLVLAGAVVVTGLVFHEASGTVHAGGLVDRGGLADPTWGFYRAARGKVPSFPPGNAGMVHDAIRDLYHRSVWWIVPALLLAALGLWRRRRDDSARWVVPFTLLSLVGLVVVASVFMFGWSGYVPRRTGASRVVLEMSLVVPPLLGIGLEQLTREQWRLRGRRILEGRRTRGPFVVAVTTVVCLISLVGIVTYDNGLAPTRQELAVWRSLPLTSRDVVLANGYTEGFIPDLTPAQGLLDGRAPYTFDAQLHRAVRLLRDAQAFYGDPAKHWDYLARNGVTWVVVGDPDTYSLATGNVWDIPGMVQALQQCRGLRLVTHEASLTAFRVVDPGPGGCAGEH